TEATRSQLTDRFASRRLGLAHLAGMDAAVEVYELTLASRAGGWVTYREAYESALALYEHGRFEEAHQNLQHLSERLTADADTPLKLLMERVRECLENPSAPHDSALYRSSGLDTHLPHSQSELSQRSG